MAGHLFDPGKARLRTQGRVNVAPQVRVRPVGGRAFLEEPRDAVDRNLVVDSPQFVVSGGLPRHSQQVLQSLGLCMLDVLDDAVDSVRVIQRAALAAEDAERRPCQQWVGKVSKVNVPSVVA